MCPIVTAVGAARLLTIDVHPTSLGCGKPMCYICKYMWSLVVLKEDFCGKAKLCGLDPKPIIMYIVQLTCHHLRGASPEVIYTIGGYFGHFKLV